MKVDVKVSGLDGVLATLKSLPPEIVSKRGGPVKLSLAKGARMLRDEAKKNLQAAIAAGADTESTGLLLDNVVASRGKAPTEGKGERYLVRVRRKAYAPRSAKTATDAQILADMVLRSRKNSKYKAVTTRKTAHLLEYGSAHQPATPWLRPALLSRGAEVVNVIVADLGRRIDLIVKKLAAQNKGK